MGNLKKKPEAAEEDSVFGKRKGGLRRRWYGNTVSGILAILAVIVLVVCVLINAYYYSNMQSGLETMAETSGSFIESYISQDYREFYQTCISLAQSYDMQQNVELQFIGQDGRLVASSFAQWSGYQITDQDVTDALQSGEKQVFIGSASVTGEHIMAVSVPLVYSSGETIGVLRYVTSLRSADRQVSLIMAIVAAVGILFGGLVVLTSHLFLRSILEPVREITTTTKRIAAGSYGSHIQKISNDEIGVLCEAINEMSDAVSRTEKMQTDLVSSVSHELRTPLTAITGWGETLLSDPNISREEFEYGMGVMLKEAKRLTGMVEELLEFSRIQDGRMTLNVELTDIRPQLEETIFIYASRLKEEGITLDYVENDEDIPEIPCDISRLRQVFLNILDNAVKHGGAGGRIVVDIRRVGREVSISVRDFGPGIPEEELPYVKSRFYKGSSKARGNGIGLAVCDEIVKLHNGTLTLSNAPGGGTLVDVRLPMEEENNKDE